MSANPRVNIVSGTVTNRRDHVPFKRTARKIFLILVLIFTAFLAFGLTLNAMAGNLVPR